MSLRKLRVKFTVGDKSASTGKIEDAIVRALIQHTERIKLMVDANCAIRSFLIKF